jgi:non-homologous end joining protein Ku
MEQATMVGARGTKTVLKIGAVEAPVILHGTVADTPKLKDYATAGPHGRPLRYVQRAAPAPVPETPAGEETPVRPGAPLDVGPGPGRERETFEDAPRARPPIVTGTVDQGPGIMRQVLIEAPGEGESDDDMPELGRSDLHRGIRQEDGTFIDLTAQLAAIEERTKLDRMEAVYTMDVGQVPRANVQGSYYVAGRSPDKGEDVPGDALHVLRATIEAMRLIRRVLVVKWTAKTRQSLGVMTVRGHDGAIVLLRLAWAEDVRVPGHAQLAHLKATVYEQEVSAMVELLEALHETKREGLDTLRDDARELREELERKALAGELNEFAVAPVPEAPAGGLMAALKASLAAARS